MSNVQNTKTRRFPKPLWLVVLALTLMVFITVAVLAGVVVPRLISQLPDKVQMRASLPAVFADAAKMSARAAAGRRCECVAYFENKLNDGKIVTIGDWPTAASMASDDYWNRTKIQRYRSQTAQPGDIVIMKADAKVYPWNNETHGWDLYFKNNPIGWGAGHIGVVTKAEYWDNEGGWFIYMQSANWSPAWGMQYEDAGCANVSDSYIFVPNGDLVSFWRAR